MKLVAALSAALLVPAAAASAGPRHAHHAPRRLRLAGAGACRVRLEVAPRAITAGEGVLAHGQLKCVGEVAGQTVTLYEATVETPFTAVGSTTTDQEGAFAIPVAALTQNSRFYAFADGARSPGKTVKVAAEVKLQGPPEGVVATALRTGYPNRVKFTGTVSPDDAGAHVVLQRQDAANGHEWFRIQRSGPVAKDGSFTITHTFVVPGPANIRVVVHSDRRNVPSASNILNYEIEQAEDPALELASTADPLSYEQSLTLHGRARTSSAAAVPDAPVKLLARTTRQRAFTLIGETTTNGSGEYSFPEQKPLVNTFYEVQVAGKTSAVLFEGVKFVLTAEASATSVEAGEAVTFSGTVNPGEGGHAIYLERANAGGTAYHVIQQPTEASGSSYSFVHYFYAAGTYVLRVAIPGGRLNGTTVSQPFTVTVGPASTPAVAPEPPGNSTQPPEGQL
ncbi:MAG TPA: hypothetical protein VL979_10280 [Solirubrobacteraceae bacterium]|nr:hypothetical protein [Solirubrobacteraceae bacterium]